MTIRRMRNACWIPKAANTPSEYVMLIAFPQQQWLHEHASMLLYTYIVSLVLYFNHVLHVACVSCSPAPSCVTGMLSYSVRVTIRETTVCVK